LHSIVVRNLVDNDADKDRIIGTSLAMRMGAAVLGLVGYLVAAPFLSQDVQTNWLIIIIVVGTLFQTLDVFDFYSQAKVAAHYTVKVRMASIIGMAIMQMALIYVEADLIWFAISITASTLFIGAGLTTVYQVKFGSLFKMKFDKAYMMELLKDSWPLIFSDLVVVLYMSTDKIMLKHMIGDDAVGSYSAALRFSEVWYFLGPMVAASLFPAIMNAKKRDEGLYKRRLQNYYNLMVVASLAITIPVALFGPWALQLPFLYGPEYADAGGVLVIHIWTLVFIFLGVASSKHLVAENQQRMELIRTLMGGVVNVILNFILIPQYGIYGAAIATLVSQIVASYLGYLVNKKFWEVFVMQTKALFLIDVIQRLLGRKGADPGGW
ncbi:MAG: flippase, partial [Bacteroidia bacterium]|nr:flippase [Bacteroidia bacterium]